MCSGNIFSYCDHGLFCQRGLGKIPYLPASLEAWLICLMVSSCWCGFFPSSSCRIRWHIGFVVTVSSFAKPSPFFCPRAFFHVFVFSVFRSWEALTFSRQRWQFLLTCQVPPCLQKYGRDIDLWWQHARRQIFAPRLEGCVRIRLIKIYLFLSACANKPGLDTLHFRTKNLVSCPRELHPWKQHWLVGT